MVDGICRLFERMSGAILNRNKKSAILGFGSWAGRQDWTLPWLHAPPALKVLSVTFSTSFSETVNLSWAAATTAVHKAVAFWASRRLHTLRLRRDALKVFIFSKLWYLAKALPLPAAAGRSYGGVIRKGWLGRSYIDR